MNQITRRTTNATMAAMNSGLKCMREFSSGVTVNEQQAYIPGSAEKQGINLEG